MKSLILRYVGTTLGGEVLTKDYDDLTLWDDLVERCGELTDMRQVQIWLREELIHPGGAVVTLDEVIVWEDR